MDRPVLGRQRPSDSRPHAAVLGAVTVPGEPGQVSRARGFVARTLADADLPGVDSEAATLLTSELVTNAVLHTDSGVPGGTVDVVVLGLPEGILIEVIDGGSPSTPVVKRDALAGEGQGLYLVQQLASQWGYRRDRGSTTVWFYLPGEPPGPGQAAPSGPQREHGQREHGQRDGRHHGPQHAGPGYPGDQQRAAASTAAQIIATSSSLVM